METTYQIPQYEGCSHRFNFETDNEEAKFNFCEAMKSDKLRCTFDGGMRVLSNGIFAKVRVIFVEDPLSDIPNIELMLSEHNNYHLNTGGMLTNDSKALEEMLTMKNPLNYKTFQDEFFFLCIRHTKEKDTDGVKAFKLYIAKKA